MCEMNDRKLEKVTELINKLLAVTVENGATENEAIEATLKVQQILAKYDMDMSQVTTKAEKITTNEIKTSNDVWRTRLAKIIADNFCCKIYGAGNNIVFYGYKRHCETAGKVFETMYNFGRKRAKEIFKEYREAGYDVNGIKNNFYIGYCAGIKNALDAQSRALMIITPPEVVESFNDFTRGFRTIKRNITHSGRREIYNRGYNAGREIASQKNIEG